MKRIQIFALVAALLSFISVKAQTEEATTSANEMIKEARAEAAKTNKNVFVMFHASWCGWCHKMDSSMNKPALKPIFEKNYVIKHITVLESADKKHLETPEGEELLKKYHGNRQGIPFWFILDKDGNLLADSRMIDAQGNPGDNVGCPARPEEVDHFLNVLKKTSGATQEQLSLVKQEFLRK